MKDAESIPTPTPTPENECEGLPPFVESWSQMYMIVVGTLFLLMGVFYAMMQYFD
ncbi:hypothetical protein [Runella slithyformis]|uniref:Uncharacterized protein n=1 Tax=Runella slithyformis (strain ATCC 29530 / DSM 19594 / LMG 11500 / NCIMB 11436 / LSU 4) TaxID=761193 RepID=A0A7U4E7Q7_RUNSL|nr:hypothetical protein [Runella slithyformis]AEI50634.1 hypothetical protein Runsl_4296 [Runella slithyformis DSM 19594]